MVGIDSNVILRFVNHDDKAQTDKARKFIDNLNGDNRGYISIVALVEVLWVLESRYKRSKKELRDFLSYLLESSKFSVQYADVIAAIIISEHYRSKDISDQIIAELGLRAGCSNTITFDKRAATIPGMQLLK